MPTTDKPPVPKPVAKKDPPKPKAPIEDPPTDLADIEIDVDDALIEPPRDDVFENPLDERKPKPNKR